MKLKVITPEGKIYEGTEVLSLTIPTTEGVVTIKDDHVPALSLISPGEVVIEAKEEKENTEMAISKGLLEIRRDSVVNVLADTAERAESIDLQRAEEARKKAEEYLKKQDYKYDKDFAMVIAKIEKELARINVAKKYKNIR